MYQYFQPPYWPMPQGDDIERMKRTKEFLDGFLKETEDKKKEKEKKERKPKTFSFIEVFILCTFGSVTIGPIIGILYLNALITFLKNSGLIELIK